MVMALGPDLESAQKELDQKQGVTPKIVAGNTLRERLFALSASDSAAG